MKAVPALATRATHAIALTRVTPAALPYREPIPGTCALTKLNDKAA
jgi:hypothetical protein